MFLLQTFIFVDCSLMDAFLFRLCSLFWYWFGDLCKRSNSCYCSAPFRFGRVDSFSLLFTTHTRPFDWKRPFDSSHSNASSCHSLHNHHHTRCHTWPRTRSRRDRSVEWMSWAELGWLGRGLFRSYLTRENAHANHRQRNNNANAHVSYDHLHHYLPICRFHWLLSVEFLIDSSQRCENCVRKISSGRRDDSSGNQTHQSTNPSLWTTSG